MIHNATLGYKKMSFKKGEDDKKFMVGHHSKNRSIDDV